MFLDLIPVFARSNRSIEAGGEPKAWRRTFAGLFAVDDHDVGRGPRLVHAAAAGVEAGRRAVLSVSLRKSIQVPAAHCARRRF